ncbi:hypothetical protein OPT61_g690 [Boeremia exigua]|uniref:Uncharacterized protein n=1 Tax=Boeremia exigua TaxID=749465 RepID=A0ACC2ISV4_9PLEO|nr:hypothetical protein OPT61_g690 [Boeremia exigua]
MSYSEKNPPKAPTPSGLSPQGTRTAAQTTPYPPVQSPTTGASMPPTDASSPTSSSSQPMQPFLQMTPTHSPQEEEDEKLDDEVSDDYTFDTTPNTPIGNSAAAPSHLLFAFYPATPETDMTPAWTSRFANPSPPSSAMRSTLLRPEAQHDGRPEIVEAQRE